MRFSKDLNTASKLIANQTGGIENAEFILATSQKSRECAGAFLSAIARKVSLNVYLNPSVFLSSPTVSGQPQGVSNREGGLVCRRSEIEKTSKPFLIAKNSIAMASGYQAWQKIQEDKSCLSLKKAFQKVSHLAESSYHAGVKLQDLTGMQSPLDALSASRNEGWSPSLFMQLNDSVRADSISARSQLMASQENWDLQTKRHLFKLDSELQRKMIERLRADMKLPSIERGGCVIDDVSLTRGFYESTRSAVEEYSEDFVQTMLDSLHEFGHEQYRRSLPEKYKGTVLGDVSGDMGDESAALFYENYVGRTPAFANYLYQILEKVLEHNIPKELTPDLILQRLLSVHKQDNIIGPDYIIYPVQNAAVFEIARTLIDDREGRESLPDLYRKYWKEYGLGNPDDTESLTLATNKFHFFSGYFDRFAAYNAGHFGAAQLFEAMKEDGIDLFESKAQMNFDKIREWMNKSLYAYGNTLALTDILKCSTGKELDPSAVQSHNRDMINMSVTF